jgi:hypothetical protein
MHTDPNIISCFGSLDDRVTSLEYDIKKVEGILDELKTQVILMDNKLALLHSELEILQPRRIKLRPPIVGQTDTVDITKRIGTLIDIT